MWSLLLLAASAANPVTERAYEREVELIRGLYLRPEEVRADRMLSAAAEGLSDDLHWLMVEEQGGAVNLRHGDGTLVGTVSVANLDTLPAALATLEQMVVRSGHPTLGVDVRLALLEGITNALDRYSRVLSGDRLTRFDVRLKGTLVGVGLSLGIFNDDLVVRYVLPDGPAKAAGVAVDDVVRRIDGRSTVNMPTSEATRRIQGEVGTTVELVVERAGKPITLNLERQVVTVPNVSSEILADGVARISISHVSQRTVANLLAEIRSLRASGALSHGLVLDLRGNTGGSMKESARTVDEFVDEGLLLRTVGPDGGQVRNLQAQMDAREGGSLIGVPVAVLIDERTASGAEIIAGGLLELDRAVLIGTRSYGKGTVQKIYPLDADVRLKLTVAQYLLPGERVIADIGLVPDVVVGKIELSSNGVHYQDWDTERTRTAHEDILPWVSEAFSWRGEELPEVDLVQELARRTVLAGTGPDRDALLQHLRVQSHQARSEQGLHLAEAFAAQGIDWSPPEGPPGNPDLHVELSAATDPDAQDVLIVIATAENRGDRPLHQTAIELSSDFRVWDAEVLPIGRLEPGATLTGQVRIALHSGVNPREDEVRPRVRAAGIEPVELPSLVLGAVSSPRPEVSAVARLQGTGTNQVAVIDIVNHSDQPLQGLEVHFAHPGDVDIELIDRAARVPVVPPKATHRFELGVRLGPKAPDALPLRLVIETPRHGKLARWPMTLANDGTPTALREPTIVATAPPLSAPAGALTLPLVVTDDGQVDHVVVYHNGAKVGWAAGGTSVVQADIPLTMVEGVNRMLVVAEDDQGLVQRQQFVIRGTGTAQGDALATPGDPP